MLQRLIVKKILKKLNHINVFSRFDEDEDDGRDGREKLNYINVISRYCPDIAVKEVDNGHLLIEFDDQLVGEVEMALSFDDC